MDNNLLTLQNKQESGKLYDEKEAHTPNSGQNQSLVFGSLLVSFS